MLSQECTAITSKHTFSARQNACSMQAQTSSTLRHLSAYPGRHTLQRQGCAVLWMLLAHALSQDMAGEVAQQLH